MHTSRTIFGYFASMLAVSLLIIYLAGCALSGNVSSRKVSKTGLFFDTVITITVYGGADADVIDECFDLCEGYELTFSKTNENSELFKLNNCSGGEVSPELLTVLRAAQYYSELSDGRFDITLGKVSDLYGFSTDSPALPATEDISAALSHTGMDKISIDERRVSYADPETEIDLGGIAKGYVADRLREHLIARGVESAIIDLGGNIMCVGSKPDGSNFTIGIQYPFKDTKKTITNVSVSGKSVVTSGIYERGFELDGRVYHHILDPETGYPYDNGVLAVSIISDSSIDGDALSTSAFALGVEDGLKLINSLDGVYAVYVTDDYQLHYSDGFEAELCA